jgi:hypothetical protein
MFSKEQSTGTGWMKGLAGSRRETQESKAQKKGCNNYCLIVTLRLVSIFTNDIWN